MLIGAAVLSWRPQRGSYVAPASDVKYIAPAPAVSAASASSWGTLRLHRQFYALHFVPSPVKPGVKDYSWLYVLAGIAIYALAVYDSELEEIVG